MNKVLEMTIKVAALLIFGPLALAVVLAIIGVVALIALPYSIVKDWKSEFVSRIKIVHKSIDEALMKVEDKVEHKSTDPVHFITPGETIEQFQLSQTTPNISGAASTDLGEVK